MISVLTRKKSPMAPICLLLTGLLVAGCGSDDSRDDDDPDPTSAPASSYSAATLVEWFDMLYAVVREERLSPPVASRLIGYMGVGAYESTVGGMPGSFSLGNQLNALGLLPPVPDGLHHWPTVNRACLEALVRGLLPNAGMVSTGNIDALVASQTATFASQASADTIARSHAFGVALAAAILDWAADDGFAFFNNCVYNVPTGPGLWQPTPPAFAANPVQPCWGQIRTFVLAFAGECSAPPPPAFSEMPGTPFYTEALEVYNTVNALTPEQLAIAEFWADNPVATGTPPGHWCSIVGQLADQFDHTLDISAEAYARVGLAVADAFISCWDMKYLYNYLRPVTFIQSPTGLNDPTWLPPLATPPFPEYTSGHSVQSGAAAQALTEMFGIVSFVDDTHAELGMPSRSFTSFNQAAEEAAISRLYGGIHFRSAIDLGIDQGVCISGIHTSRIRWRLAP